MIHDSSEDGIARARTTRIIQNYNRATLSDPTIQQMTQHIVKLELKLQTVHKLLSKHCDEIEGMFDGRSEQWLKDYFSPASAMDYVKSATWLRDNFSRTNNRIEDVQRWIDNYLPFGS